MKVLITTDLYTVKTNGVVTSVNTLCQALEAHGHEVRILTLSNTLHSYQEGNVTYIASMPIGYIYPDVRAALRYRPSVLQQLVDWKPDVIHSQCEFFSYQIAKRLAKKLNVPLIHTYHTLYEQYVPYLTHCKRGAKYIAGTFSKLRLRSADHIIAPTEKVARTLWEYGVANPVSVIPSGIAQAQSAQKLTEEERAALRAALDIPQDSRIILNLGRLGIEKNLEELLHFTAELLTPDSGRILLFVGDGPARQSLEALTDRLGIREQVRFSGRVEPSQVYRYYQLADVFVNASTSETQGLTYIEAAANGLPLVCRRDPCLEQVLEERKNGFSYRQKEEYQAALRYVLDNPQWRKAAAVCSKANADRFTPEQFAAAVEKLYLADIAGNT